MKNTLTVGFTLFSFLFLITSCLQDQEQVFTNRFTDDEFQTIKAGGLNLDQEIFRYRIGGQVGPVDNFKATLGRVLFYDTRLSVNNKISCASCHEQSVAFADPDRFSEGVKASERTSRNSFALGAVKDFKTSYGGSNSFAGHNNEDIDLFWDGRVRTFHDQMDETIQNPVEMGQNPAELVDEIKDVEMYKVLFNRTYGSETVTFERITDALTEFMNAFSVEHSKFLDGRSLAGGVFAMDFPFDNFTLTENKGKALYIQHCGSCHGRAVDAPDQRFASNGLDVEYNDKGLGEVTGQSFDNGVFKVPTLHNIAVTGPFMHDGRFDTLEEVIEHYSTGIQNHPNLDEKLKENGTAKQLNFTATEKKELLAFLRTLTDHEFLEAPEFSSPF